MNENQFPTLLNKSDAMLHAAGLLDQMVSNMRLIKAFSAAFSQAKATLSDPEAQKTIKLMEVAARGIVDATIQEKAMREAAEEIRAMATEAKLIEARMTSKV